MGMATRKLFYDHPDLGECEARVVERRLSGDDLLVVLDATPFHPDGGGQPHDGGTIAGLPVASVEESDGVVTHRLALSGAGPDAVELAPGSIARCVVDLERRRDHSVQHSAQHLLSAVCLASLGARTLSFHLGEAYSSIDLDVAPPERSALDRLEDEVMSAVRRGAPFRFHTCSLAEAGRFPLRKQPSVEAGELRVVEIEGLDFSACCGTHVASASALELVRILRADRYKAGSRLSFVAGRRALADYRRLATLARETGAAAACAEDALPSAVLALKDRQKALERSLETALDEAAEARAELAVARSPTAVVYAEAPGAPEALRLAKAIARLGAASVVIAPLALKAIASDPRPAADLGALYAPLVAAAGGKGGGATSFYQAAFPSRGALEAFLESVRD